MRRKYSFHPATISNYLLVSLFAFACLAPFLFIFTMSITSEEAYGMYGVTLFPRAISLEAYAYLFQYADRLFNAYGVSIFLSTVGMSLNLLVTAMLAYPLSRRNMPYRNTFMKMILFTMLFNGGLIPQYLLVRNLGLMDRIGALILPFLIYSWNLIIMRNFFQTLPDSLIESAHCDGANDLLIFVRIVLPLSKSIVATIGLFYAVGYWNSWFPAMLYISDAQKWPAMLFLKNILYNYNNAATMIGTGIGSVRPPSEALRMACVIVIVLPILFSYPFAQKYFVKGIMLGSLKG